MTGVWEQLYIFLLATATGFVGGVVYEPFSMLRQCVARMRNAKWFTIVVDSLFWVCFAGICIFVEYLFEFPDFRLYIWSGYALGGIIYLKTLHRIVAFFEKVCYNKLAESIKKGEKERKNSEKTDGSIKYDARKNEKIDNRNRRIRYDASRDSFVRVNLSMD